MTTYKQNIQKLDSEWRRKALPPKETLLMLGLSPTDTMVDLGCGIGYFTIPAAAILTGQTWIYAVDPAEEMIAELRVRIDASNAKNIYPVVSEPFDFKLPEGIADFVLLANVFHEIQGKELFLEQLIRILKPNGRLALIEWAPGKSEFGPPEEHRIAPEETERWMGNAGFRTDQKLTFGEMFYGRVFVLL